MAYKNLKYGVTLEFYRQKLTQQDGKCMICSEIMARPCLDHDHVTNQVRDFLCHYCNNAIGFAKESPELLIRMIDYLKKHKQENSNVPSC